MKQTIQLLLIIFLILCSGYALMNQQFVFSKVMTNYYTSSEPFIDMHHEEMTVHMKTHQQTVAEELIALRDDVHAALVEVFPTTKHSDLSILLLDKDDEAYERYLADQTIGVYLPMLNMMMLDSTANVRHTFVHEYTHYLVDQQLEQLAVDEGRFPDWFHEGLANYAEYRVLGELPFTYSRFHAAPFAELKEQTNENMHTVYHQGFYAIVDLIHVYGDDIIAEIIAETNTTREFTNGFTRATNIHLATYHERFVYDAEEMATLYAGVYTQIDEVKEKLDVRAQQYATVNPASKDDLLVHIATAIQLDDRTRIHTLLKQYHFLLQQPELYLQLADLLMSYDATLARELLEKGEALETNERRVTYEAKVAALYGKHE